VVQVLQPCGCSHRAQLWYIYYVSLSGLSYNEWGSPVISNGRFYAGSNDGNFYAYDIATKNRLWTFPTGNNVFSSAVLSEGLLYFGNSSGNMYALKAETGSLVWSAGIGTVYGSACVVDKNGVRHYPAVSGEKN
jgi:outer membrane protein assembly factor BamB